MESPSSARRVTRSQALAASGNSNNIPVSKKVEGSEKGISKSRQRTGNQQDRSALIDITNDSPIVGLAMGRLETPSSNFSKKRIISQSSKNSDTTPGSGEALLRGQVKTLLQKVEEEAELSKFSLDNHVNGPFLHLKGLVNSPMACLAPTPNNTPHVSNLSGNESAEKNGLTSVTSSPVQEHFTISQMVTEIFDGLKKQESVESEKSLITRSLLFDFTDKSEDSYDSSDCTSLLTYQGGGSAGSKVMSSTDDEDEASIWSIQVNASTRDEEDDDDNVEDEVAYIEEDDDSYEEGEEGEEYGDDGLLDDLCEGLSKFSVNGRKFTGKHMRFVYNSDGELEGEEYCGDVSADSPGVLHLKGLPTPKGKHLRFPIED